MATSWKPILILFLSGATLGTACDLFHNISHTSAYTHPKIFGLACWVPLLFGSATALIGWSHAWMDKVMNKPRRRLGWSQVVFGLMSFAGIYCVSGFYQRDDTTLIVTLAVLSLAVWAVHDKTLYGLGLAVATAVIGSGVEGLLSHLGQFYYLKPDILGIPYWLPFLYLAASVSVGNLGRKLLAI